MSEYDTAMKLLGKANPQPAFRPQPWTDWSGEFSLPSAVVQYFAELGPLDVWIPNHGNPYFLPSLSHLWSFQAGYRYHPDTRKKLPGWDEDWLVIADEGGDAFIFSRASGVILHAFHGDGIWQPTQIFNCLAAMVTTFAIIGDIVATAGRALTDDDSLILPCHREAARKRIGEFLRSDEKSDAIVSCLGWS